MDTPGEEQPGEEQPGFAVLLVCTANHCRSPMAEHLLRDRLPGRGLTWTVTSAGTRAEPGHPMHPYAARALAARGIVTDGWTSQPLDRERVERADLVLTATEAHTEVVGRLSPAATGRTFTLRQLAHLVRAAPERVAGLPVGPALLWDATSARGRVQPLPRDERDLPDPVGQPYRRFRRCADLIASALDDVLAGRSGDPG